MAPGSGWLTIGNDKQSRDQIIDAYYNSLYNGSQRLTGNPITFGFIAPSSPITRGFDQYANYSESNKSVVRSYFAYFNELLSASFVESQSNPGIRFSGAIDLNGDATAGGYATYSGANRFSVVKGAESPSQPGSYVDLTIIHELGHALGLSHPYPYNDEDRQPPERSTSPLPAEFDSSLTTVMSYYFAQLSSSFEGGKVGTQRTFSLGQRKPVWSYVNSFSPLDWRSLESLYGKASRSASNMTYNVYNKVPFGYDPVARVANISAATGFSITNEVDYITLDASRVTRNSWNFLDIRTDAGIDLADGYRLTDKEVASWSYTSLQDSWDSDNFWSIYIDADVKVERVIGSAMNDNIEGDELTQTLIGGLGNDVISAYDGDDFVDGGSGRDHLTGGIGADSFVLGAPQGKLAREINDADWLPPIPRVDIITDFSSVQGDKLLISSSLLGKSSLQQSDILLFAGASKKSLKQATASASILLFDTSSGYLFLNQNLSSSGFGAGGYVAQLNGVSSLDVGNFVVI